MIQSALPGFLWAGAAFALVPVALHLLTRRPPARQPLPTARFLSEDARTELRLRTRPTDLILLAVRMMFALLLGASFAELTWERHPEGDVHVVLLDAGADPQGSWESALTEVGQAVQEVSGDDESEVVVLAYGATGGTRLLDPDALSELRPGGERMSFDDGLRALRWTARVERWASVEVSWITRPTWARWRSGLTWRREATWPGGVKLFEPPSVESQGRPGAEASGSEASGSEAARVQVLVDSEPQIAQAIAALGATTPDPSVGASDAAPVDWIVAEGSLDGLVSEADTFLRAGGTLLVARGSASTGNSDSPTSGAVPGGRVVAVSDEALPLAFASMRGNGCIVSVERPWNEVADDKGPELPDFIRTLVLGCESGFPAVPLDSGARSVLVRADLAERVTAAQLGGSGPRLTRWILGSLLLLLATELLLTSGRWTRRLASSRTPATGSS